MEFLTALSHLGIPSLATPLQGIAMCMTCLVRTTFVPSSPFPIALPQLVVCLPACLPALPCLGVEDF